MISRRKALNIISSLPMGGILVGGWASSNKASGMPHNKPASTFSENKWKEGKSIYESIGVRPLINGRGTVTIIGASRVLPEVEQAMHEAMRDYVQLDELMEGVGKRLAELTGTEWGVVTSGASAAITAGTAGCITGGDPDKIWQIPDLSGLKDEVIIPSYSQTAYDAAARAVGIKMVRVETKEELIAALGPRTAMIMVLAGSRSENGPLSLKEIASLAKPLGVPILVDAAAEGLLVPNPHIDQGADMVAYSGGKYLRGPQCTGLLIGRKDLVHASWIATAPHHGFGRGFKVGREEIMGALTAVEMWMKRDHEGCMHIWTSRLAYISRSLQRIPGVSTEIIQPKGRSNHSPSLSVQWDHSKIPLTGHEVEKLLWEKNPRIAVSGAGSFLPFPPNMDPDISINSSQLEDGEEKFIADGVFSVLSNPPHQPKQADPAAFDLSGQWEIEMKFSASTVTQTFFFEQKNNSLTGTHYASFAPRKLIGSLQGQEILIRSSYTGQGVRLNFEFTGKVNGDTMEGRVSMGEYGMADWKAKRSNY